jgi:hypothetical protein
MLFSYSAEMWALAVIKMMRNPELCQTFSEISDPRWSCSTMEICGSATPKQFFQSWISPKHALRLTPTTHCNFNFASRAHLCPALESRCLQQIHRKANTSPPNQLRPAPHHAAPPPTPPRSSSAPPSPQPLPAPSSGGQLKFDVW